MPADQRRDRVARQAQKRGVAHPSRHQRFSRPHGDLVEGPFHPEALGHRADQVVIAHRRAAHRHDQVGAARQPENGGQALGIVARDGQKPRNPALRLDQGLQPVGVGGHDLVVARHLAG
jgi:hypothetical protein